MAIVNHAPGARRPWPSRGHAAVIAAAVAVVLLLVRAPDAFTNPQLYAEDAVIFWFEAYRDGPKAFFAPYAGYLHAVQRIVAWVGSWLAPAAAPALYNAAAVAITAWAAATVACTLPNPRTGVCCAIALLLAPNPDGALLANLTHIQWLMAAPMALLLLSDPAANSLVRRSNAVFVLLAGLWCCTTRIRHRRIPPLSVIGSASLSCARSAVRGGHGRSDLGL